MWEEVKARVSLSSAVLNILCHVQYSVSPPSDDTDYAVCDGYPYAYLNSEKCDRTVLCPNGDDEFDCGKISVKRKIVPAYLEEFSCKDDML